MIGEHVTIDYDRLGDVIEFESYVFPRNYQWNAGYDAYEKYILARCEILLKQVAILQKQVSYGSVDIYLYKRMGKYPGFYVSLTNRIYISIYDLYYQPTILAHEISHYLQTVAGVPLDKQESKALWVENYEKEKR